MDEVVKVQNLTKSFKIDQGVFSKIFKIRKSQKIFTAIDNISFSVDKGEVLGIIGLNGSGKTTLLRLIAGIFQPSNGHIKTTGTISPLMQLGIGFHGDLNASENIKMSNLLLGRSTDNLKTSVDKILNYAELNNFSHLKLKFYSTGMRARLAFATAMQMDPDIVLIDEILSVGDKDFREKSMETFLSFKEKKKTILFTSHNLKLHKEITDKMLLLDRGKNIIFGNPNDVIKKYLNLKSSNDKKTPAD